MMGIGKSVQVRQISSLLSPLSKCKCLFFRFLLCFLSSPFHFSSLYQIRFCHSFAFRN
jgi:hypothetical protein